MVVRLVSVVVMTLVSMLLGTLVGSQDTPPASAWHWRNADLWSAHRSDYSEEVCVDVLDTSINQTTAYNSIINILYAPGSFDSRAWDGNFYRIYFIGAGATKCSQQPGGGGSIEVHFRVTSSGCGGGTSCQGFDRLDNCNWHCEYWYSIVNLRAAGVSSAHEVNHETSHTVGLADPVYPTYFTPPNANHVMCNSYYTSDKTAIAHSVYYCGSNGANPAQPGPDDIWCAENLAFYGPWGHCNP